MLKKKVTMLGAFAVGKTSLVQQFVHSIFSERYQTTIGVRIDQKNLYIKDTDITLMLWDLYGQDDFMKVKASYLLGSSAYILVVDGTRHDTIATAHDLHQLAIDTLGKLPFVMLINKADLEESWEISSNDIQQLRDKGYKIFITSAKEGTNVEAAFYWLTEQMIAQ